MQDPNTMDKLWSQVDKRGPDECWPWTGHRSKRGYGLISWHNQKRRVTRLILGLEPGDPRQSRHTCDNPPCCNPRHLLPGTALDNARDREQRHRGVRAWTKLTDDQIRTIRADGRTPYRVIAADYAVSPSYVSLIKRHIYRQDVA